MTLKFNKVLEVDLDVRAKFHQAKSSGSWVTNSALDFDKRKTVLWTTIFPRTLKTIWWILVH